MLIQNPESQDETIYATDATLHNRKLTVTHITHPEWMDYLGTRPGTRPAPAPFTAVCLHLHLHPPPRRSETVSTPAPDARPLPLSSYSCKGQVIDLLRITAHYETHRSSSSFAGSERSTLSSTSGRCTLGTRREIDPPARAAEEEDAPLANIGRSRVWSKANALFKITRVVLAGEGSTDGGRSAPRFGELLGGLSRSKGKPASHCRAFSFITADSLRGEVTVSGRRGCRRVKTGARTTGDGDEIKSGLELSCASGCPRQAGG
ncbi:hypothetical protein C8Q72DRAFT_8652 [Fomitopsis betulina]|nr:hypothetical protein C8Q72DRAFT_8652 [Fomitopsis betulina]